MRINEALNAYVSERGIKQNFISEKTGLSVDAVSRILNSKRKISAEEFLKICDAIDLDPRMLLKTA